MGHDPIYELNEEDRGLRVGLPVTAHWTAAGFAYHASAEIIQVESTAVTVRLLERTGGHDEYGPGQLVTLPRRVDMGRWSSGNCVRYDGRNRAV
jgi:hypothetical protein